MSKKFIITIITLLTIGFFISISSRANENLKAEKIDSLMTYCYENGLFNGAILVSYKNEVIYEKAFGYADYYSKDTLNLNTSFYLASISKPFTSTAIMILKENGKLNLDKKLIDFFPEFPDYADKITIKHLLYHQSGIPNYTSFKSFKTSSGDFIDNISNQDVLDFLVKRDSLEFSPGEKYKYSNSGYVLLSMIVEKVSHLPFPIFMKQNVFELINMKNTFVLEKTKSETPYKAIGFNEYEEKDDYNIFTTGAGGIYSTVEDLYKFDQALYTNKLISQSSFEESILPQKYKNGSIYFDRYGWSYGYGWEVRKDSINHVVRHTGGFNGFSTVFQRELNKHSAIILLTNRGQNSWQRGSTMVALLNILEGKPFDLPKLLLSIKFKKIIEDRGVNDFIVLADSIIENHTQEYMISERNINSLAYYYLEKTQYDKALAIFNINCQLYPKSFNSWDSYAECLYAMKQYDKAIDSYKKSIELNPQNKNAKHMIENIRIIKIKK